jgi:hypothetical protein
MNVYVLMFHACFECEEGQRQKRDYSKPRLGQNFTYSPYCYVQSTTPQVFRTHQ